MSSATDPAQAILAMVNWLGLIVMPIMAALFLAVGVYKYSKGESMERCVIGVLVAISISGITRLAEFFVATSAGNSVASDTYSNALLNLTNWVANVILPVYAAFEVVRADFGGPEAFAERAAGTERAAGRVGFHIHGDHSLRT